MKYLQRAAQLAILAASVATSASAQDTCASALPLIGNSGAQVFPTNSFFLAIPPWTCGGNPATPSNAVWFYFDVPDFVSEFTVDTCTPVPGFGFDTRLEVLTGANCGSLTVIRCNDDSSCGLLSSITMSGVTAGERYYIRAGGYDGAIGALAIALTHPPAVQPNECSQAVPLTEGAETSFQTVGASTSPPAWSCGLGGNDIWFRYTAATNSQGFFVSTRGSAYDTVTEVFSGDCNSLTNVTCNDDYAGLFQGTAIVHNPVPGQVYLIRLGGYNGLTGTGTVVVREFESIGANQCSAELTAAGTRASISAIGSGTAEDRVLTLRTIGVPPNQFGLFAASRNADFVPAAMVPSNGNLCLGGSIGRFNTVVQANAAGEFSLPVGLIPIPQFGGSVQINAGELWFFQAWFRDPGGFGSNFSDARRFIFE